MNLPDINEVHPRLGPVVLTDCTFCGTEIHKGDEVVSYDGLLFCDRICMATELLKNGVAVNVVAG